MNGVSIFVMKQFGFGLGALGQGSREKSVIIGQGTTQIGSGTWMKSLSKLTVRDFYLWRAVDHEGEVLESFVTKRRNKAAAKKFLIKTMRKHGLPKIIITDKLASYRAALHEICVADRQLCGGRFNNRCENSHLLFRRRERAMQRFKKVTTLQQFVSYHSQIYNHFNHQRHLESRLSFKHKRATALTEWFNFCAA